MESLGKTRQPANAVFRERKVSLMNCRPSSLTYSRAPQTRRVKTLHPQMSLWLFHIPLPLTSCATFGELYSPIFNFLISKMGIFELLHYLFMGELNEITHGNQKAECSGVQNWSLTNDIHKNFKDYSFLS